MKNLFTTVALASILLLTALPAFAQKADFTGNWLLDKTKSSIVTDQPTMIKLQVRMTSDSLLTVRTYDRGDNQEYPFNENLGLDSKDCNIVIFDMPRKSKAGFTGSDGSLTFESTTTFSTDSGPADFKSKEVWKLDKEKKILTIEFRNNMSGNDTNGSWTYSKVDQL
jgi:hypothetical protein